MEGISLNRHIPKALLDAVVLDDQGEAHPLSSLLGNKPTLLVFVRHFGCIGCTLQMQSIGPRIRELDKLGIQTIVIGNGEAHYIEGFRERHMLHNQPVRTYTDPSLNIHKLAQLKRSFWIALGPVTWYEFIIAWSKGVGQKSIEGDNGQMGGTIFMDEHKKVRYFFRNKTVANHADPNELFDHIYAYLGEKMNSDAH